MMNTVVFVGKVLLRCGLGPPPAAATNLDTENNAQAQQQAQNGTLLYGGKIKEVEIHYGKYVGYNFVNVKDRLFLKKCHKRVFFNKLK